MRAAAKDAYARVPTTSSHYRDAQNARSADPARAWTAR
jgi:hypothetical protein